MRKDNKDMKLKTAAHAIGVVALFATPASQYGLAIRLVTAIMLLMLWGTKK